MRAYGRDTRRLFLAIELVDSHWRSLCLRPIHAGELRRGTVKVPPPRAKFWLRFSARRPFHVFHFFSVLYQFREPPSQTVKKAKERHSRRRVNSILPFGSFGFDGGHNWFVAPTHTQNTLMNFHSGRESGECHTFTCTRTDNLRWIQILIKSLQIFSATSHKWWVRAPATFESNADAHGLSVRTWWVHMRDPQYANRLQRNRKFGINVCEKFFARQAEQRQLFSTPPIFAFASPPSRQPTTTIAPGPIEQR